VSRILAAVISIHGDDRGLRLPSILAPSQIAIIPIPKGKNSGQEEKIISYSEEVAIACAADGWRCSRDTSDNSPGYKFNHWELMGVPLRIEVGLRETERREVTIACRTSGQKITAPIDALSQVLPDLIRRRDQELAEDASLFFEAATADAETMDELIEVLNKHRGFVRVPFCSINQEGEACAEILKREAHGIIVCGVPLENEGSQHPDSVCIVCGKPSQELVYSARSF